MHHNRQSAGMLAVLLGSLLLTRGALVAPPLLAAEPTPAPTVPAWQPAEPSDDGQTDGSAGSGSARDRYTVATRRGGTPDLGVASARGLPLPNGTEAADFTLAADIRFERGGGPAAATVRFRYRPEAGGGTGYLLSVDPFAGQVRLVAFEDGRQDVLMPWTAYTGTAVGSGSMHLVLETVGPTMTVSLDGEEVLRTSDARFAGGLLAVGAVTWSEPVRVTFENVVLTVPDA